MLRREGAIAEGKSLKRTTHLHSLSRVPSDAFARGGWICRQ